MPAGGAVRVVPPPELVYADQYRPDQSTLLPGGRVSTADELELVLLSESMSVNCMA